MNITAVMGTFDASGGKPSGYAGKIWAEVLKNLSATNVSYYNGGSYDNLDDAFKSAIVADIVIWWANVPNDAPIEKLVGDIKAKNPKALLVVSKNNLDGKYNWIDLIGRLLKAHASLGLVVEKQAGLFVSTILDPLGNAYSYREVDVKKIGAALGHRITTLRTYTRMRSVCMGPSREIVPNLDIVNFCETIKAHAETFHALVHSANPSRFVGNAAFRCTHGGFPAFRSGGKIFVSRRNIDKRDITPNGFVEIESIQTGKVEYYGENPPSVDTPVQFMLFEAFPTMNFMIHAHVYLETSLLTKSNVPCGALEEFSEIMLHKTAIDAGLATHGISMINLRGHGCLVLSTNVAALKSLPWKGRPLPETSVGV